MEIVDSVNMILNLNLIYTVFYYIQNVVLLIVKIQVIQIQMILDMSQFIAMH